jgi:beta-N-acetylhexosaminidase
MGEAMTRWRPIGLGGCLTIVMVLAGCGGSRGVPAQKTPVGSSPAPVVKAAEASSSAPATTPQPAPEPQAAPGLPTTQARAAARMFLVGYGGPTVDDAVLKRFALHAWGGVVLEPGNGASPQQVADAIGRIRSTAARAKHQAPLIAASQLGGDLDAVPVGGAPQPQAADAKAARAAALGEAKALHPLGVRMVLGPDADIGFAGGPWEGVAFADDAQTVTDLTSAAVAGWKDGQIAAAPGHFPGEGAASGDPALEAATVGLSLDELKARDLKPFVEAARHAPAMQLSAATYVAWDGVTPATLLPEVVKLLRDGLGFGGVIVSGDLSAASLAGGEPVSALAVQAIKAGVDLVWIPGDAGDQDAAWRAVVRALRTGVIPASRVAEALKRVSLLRASYGVK